MALEKQTFNPGDVLPSSKVNEIQDAIIENQEDISNLEGDIADIQSIANSESAKNTQQDTKINSLQDAQEADEAKNTQQDTKINSLQDAQEADEAKNTQQDTKINSLQDAQEADEAKNTQQDTDIAAIKKKINNPIVTSAGSDGTIIIEDNQEARLSTLPLVSEVPTLILNLPEIIDLRYTSMVVVPACDAAPTIIYGDISWSGVDCNSEGLFTPVAGVNYILWIKNIGIEGTPKLIGNVSRW